MSMMSVYENLPETKFPEAEASKPLESQTTKSDTKSSGWS